MNSDHPASSFTADAFLEWTLEQPVKRLELVNGRVAQHLPLSFGHLRAGEDVVHALRGAIAAVGAGCEVFPRGAGVRVEPDAVVCCGPSIPGDAVALVNPIIVVEIASCATASTERGKRQRAYFKLDSVQHYLVVDTGARIVVHHYRDEAGAVQCRLVRQGMVELAPPGLALSADALFTSLGG